MVLGGVVVSYERGTPVALHASSVCRAAPTDSSEREFFIDSLLVRIHYIIVMIKWTGLAPWEFEFTDSGARTGASPLEDQLGGRQR